GVTMRTDPAMWRSRTVSSWMEIGSQVLTIMIMGIVFTVLFPATSEAIPAFARKYDLSCTACHTKPPRLNPFGEAFHMAGFQIPMTVEGEIREKRKIGRVWSETDFLNIFAIRGTGNLVEAFQGGDRTDFNLIHPQEAELYLAGTFTQEISYFFELNQSTGEIEGKEGGLFEEKSGFGIGEEFFLMLNLEQLFSKDPMAHGGAGGTRVMGPMVMVGKIDPSTNFSYPANRQYLLNVPGRIEGGGIKRFTLAPYAFASKFFGMETGKGEPIEVTKEVLYNTTGDFGLDLHAMVGEWIFQTGVMQGLRSSAADVNAKKDPYFMARMNFGGEEYLSGSLSGLVYWGNDTGRIARRDGSTETVLVDWLRYGFAGNVKYRLVDLYGAFIWDRLQGLPAETRAALDEEAFGFTVEGDTLASDSLLLSARYDQLNAGGFLSRRADGRVVTLQARYYLRDNFAFYLRESVNLKERDENPLLNFRNLIALGVDFDL
ncbi:MAG TPA: hypothetical protein VIK48_02480, partial [Candidatus Manganitrophaceae bacterium]